MSHRSQAEYNETVANEFEKRGYGDWMITALFYAGLHYVCDVIPACASCSTHQKREKAIRETNKNVAYGCYKILSERSRQMRYIPKVAEAARRNTAEAASLVKPVLDKLKIELGIMPPNSGA